MEEVDVSLAQMLCFVTTVDAGSIAGAAKTLGISSAGASRTLARLEASSGVRLLHRSTHSVSLTPEGRALIEPARLVVAAARGWTDALAIAGGEDGQVRISAPVGLTRSILAPLLAEYGRLHPETSCDVRASNQMADLAEGAIDVAIRSGPLDGVPGHVQQRWFAAPWIVAASPGYIGEARIETAPDLQSHRLLGFRNARTGQIQGWPLKGDDGTPLQVRSSAGLIFDDGDSCWQAALAGAGIACAPLWLAADALRDGRAVELLRSHRGEPVEVAFLRLERRMTPPRVSALLAFLVERPPYLTDLM